RGRVRHATSAKVRAVVRPPTLRGTRVPHPLAGLSHRRTWSPDPAFHCWLAGPVGYTQVSLHLNGRVIARFLQATIEEINNGPCRQGFGRDLAEGAYENAP